MSSDSQTAPGGRQKVTLSNVVINDRSYPGEVFVTVFGDDTLKRGDAVTVSGDRSGSHPAMESHVVGGDDQLVHVGP